MEKETPSLPPANMVPVKKVKLNRTIEMEKTPLRPAAGASTSGKSLLFDMVEPLSGYPNSDGRGVARGVPEKAGQR